MALSMDEQRMLEEIERRLADEDPVLAARLTAFRHPGLAIMLRSRRGRVLVSLIALVVAAVICVTVYAFIPISGRGTAKLRPVPASSQPMAPRSATAPAGAPSPPAGPASVSSPGASSSPAGAVRHPSPATKTVAART